MIEEYHQEELQQTTFEEGKLTGEQLRQREIAEALLKEGIATDIIAKTTTLSEKELTVLQKKFDDER
ncbi:MAG: hypothetical protein GY801_48870 [bacterium]|nr:hypothetical protein [bacterium]